VYAFWRWTDRQTDIQTNRWTEPTGKGVYHYRERRLKLRPRAVVTRHRCRKQLTREW